MDATNIVEYLRSMDEPQMAAEVESMARRLDAFADGLDKDCIATAVAAEREACAQVAEAAAKTMGDLGRKHRDDGHEDSMDRCYARSLQCTQVAADIRARSNA